MSQDPSDRSTPWVVADGPINLRTALREEREALNQAEASGVPDHLQAHADRLADRVLTRYQRTQTLGLSLHESLLAPHVEAVHAPTHSLGAWGWCSLSLGALALGAAGWGLVAASATPLIFAAALGGGAAGAWTLKVSRQRTTPTDQAPQDLLQGLTPEVLQQCDHALHTVAQCLDAGGQARLISLKSQWLNLVRQLRHLPPHSTSVSMEDRLYAVECLRRYLPDTLNTFLAVPPDQRTPRQSEPQPEALVLFYEQLEVLEQGLAQRLTKAQRHATEALARQHRFLKAKHHDAKLP